MGLSAEINNKNYTKDVLKSSPGTAIAVSGVRFRYSKDSPLALDIDHLAIPKGQRVAIVGASGSGKTTFLRILNGFIEPDSGEIEILGNILRAGSRRSPEVARRIGFIFQNFNLVERATVFENVLWGRMSYVNPLYSLLGWFPRRDKLIAGRAISEVNLSHQINQRADTLSGGQIQRVAIARVLAQEPEIILADEPVSNLDPSLTDDVMALLVEVSENHGVTLLMNLHQTDLAKRFADRIIGLKGGMIVYDSSDRKLSGDIPKSIFDHKVQSVKLSYGPNSK